jgi:hypothetical protein
VQLARHSKVGCCTDIHVRRGGNLVHILGEVLNFCVVHVSTYCVYIALIYLVKLSYELT